MDNILKEIHQHSKHIFVDAQQIWQSRRWGVGQWHSTILQRHLNTHFLGIHDFFQWKTQRKKGNYQS